jgi:hypothetical protein
MFERATNISNRLFYCRRQTFIFSLFFYLFILVLSFTYLTYSDVNKKYIGNLTYLYSNFQCVQFIYICTFYGSYNFSYAPPKIFTYICNVDVCIYCVCIVWFPSVILTSIDFRKIWKWEVSTYRAHVVCFSLFFNFFFLVLHVHILEIT